MHNAMKLALHGALIPESPCGGVGRQEFVAATNLELKVAWTCIEAFPPFRAEDWQVDRAADRAEKDILAAVVAKNLSENEFRNLDPHASARRMYAKLFREFSTLLDSNPEREETLQKFLKAHPELVCPAYIRC